MAGRENIPERDWKVLRGIKDAALERLCHEILSAVVAQAPEEDHSYHQRFQAVYETVETRNKHVALAFDRMSRSNAIDKLYAMRAMKLVTDEEFSRFSEPTREIVEKLIEILQA